MSIAPPKALKESCKNRVIDKLGRLVRKRREEAAPEADLDFVDDVAGQVVENIFVGAKKGVDANAVRLFAFLVFPFGAKVGGDSFGVGPRSLLSDDFFELLILALFLLDGRVGLLEELRVVGSPHCRINLHQEHVAKVQKNHQASLPGFNLELRREGEKYKQQRDCEAVERDITDERVRSEDSGRGTSQAHGSNNYEDIEDGGANNGTEADIGIFFVDKERADD